MKSSFGIKELDVIRSALDHRALTSPDKPSWSFSGWAWPVLWSRTCVGYLWANSLLGLESSKIEKLRIFLGNIRSCFWGHSPRLYFSANFQQKDNLVHTWILPGEYANFLSGEDRYFGRLEEVDFRECMFLVDLLDENEAALRDLLAAGCLVIRKERDRYRPFRAFKIIKSNIKNFSIETMISLIDFTFVDGELIYQQLAAAIDISKIKSFLTPYEAQPVQQRLIFEFQKRSKAKTIGYVHSSLSCFPSYISMRPGAPNRVLVHGSAYKHAMTKYLGWTEESILIIDSLRFAKPRPEMAGAIFLPFAHRSTQMLTEMLSRLFELRVDLKRNWEIRPHPAVAVAQADFLKNVEEIVGVECGGVDICKPTPNSSAIQLGVSGAILECLESGIDVFHIVEDPRLDSYAEELWPDLEITKLDSNIFHYKLRSRGSFIRYRTSASPTFKELRVHLMADQAAPSLNAQIDAPSHHSIFWGEINQ